MKIVTWNVNGIRSRIFNDKTSAQIGKVKDVLVQEGSSMSQILDLNPDIITLQETRCDTQQGARFKIPGFKSFFNESKETEHRGPNRYSGTCLFISEKIDIEKIEYSIDGYNDTEGRIVILYLKDTVLLGVYAPNSGTNYEKKIKFNEARISRHNSLDINDIEDFKLKNQTQYS